MEGNLVALVAAAHQLAFEKKLQSFQLATGFGNIFAPAGQAVAAQQEAVAQRVGLRIIFNARRQGVDILVVIKNGLTKMFSSLQAIKRLNHTLSLFHHQT